MSNHIEDHDCKAGPEHGCPVCPAVEIERVITVPTEDEGVKYAIVRMTNEEIQHYE